MIALLGGEDDTSMSTQDRRAAHETLRGQIDDTGVRMILVAALPHAAIEQRQALAELAATLRAPLISLGTVLGEPDYAPNASATGSYAALDLAADLVDGVRLPTLSATVRIKAPAPDAFLAGSILYGVVYVQNEICPWECLDVPLEFAVTVP